MGIYDRDYYRDEGRSPNFFSTGARFCKIIIALTVVVHILQMLGNNPGLLQWFSLSSAETIYGYQWWRVISYLFLHELNVWHILFNMLVLWWFGEELESIYGTREFGVFYFVGGICAGLAFLLLAYFTKTSGAAIGASGAIASVFVAYAYLFPRRVIMMFGIIPIEARWLATLYFILDLYPVMLQIGGAERTDGVAHAAHLGGAIFGFLYARNNWRITPVSWRYTSGSWFSGWRRPRMRAIGGNATIGSNRPARTTPRKPSHLKIFDGDPDDSEQNDSESSAIFKKRVDDVLAKISREGQESLTAEEKEILIEASQKFRDKKQLP